MFRKSLPLLLASFADEQIRATLKHVDRLVGEDHVYEALKAIRALYRAGERHHRTGPAGQRRRIPRPISRSPQGRCIHERRTDCRHHCPGQPAPTETKSKTAVDYESFLKLLVAEMKNQDPTKPMESTDFVAQLATFSQVEQCVQSTPSSTRSCSRSALSQAGSLIGRDDHLGRRQDLRHHRQR